MGIFDKSFRKKQEKLIKALKNEDWRVRSHTVDALGERKDARAVEPLIQVLKDKDLDVRSHAAKAIRKIKGRG